MKWILESKSIDNKKHFPISGQPYQVKELEAIQNAFVWNRWTETKFSNLKEIGNVIEYSVPIDFKIKGVVLDIDNNNVIPYMPDVLNIRYPKPRIVEKTQWNLHASVVYLNKDFTRENLLYIVLAVDGDWFLIFDQDEIDVFLANAKLIKAKYSVVQNKRPSTNLNKANTRLSFMQALTMLRRFKSTNGITDAWVNIAEVREDFSIEAFPSTSNARWSPDLKEFSWSMTNNVILTYTVKRGSAIPYYYTGPDVAEEFAIVWLDEKWHWLEADNARLWVTKSRDDSRAKMLTKSFKSASKIDIDKEIERTTYYIALNDINANLYELETDWSFFDLVPVNDEWIAKGDTIKTFEIPPIKTLAIEHQDRTKWLYFDGSWWLVRTSIEFENAWSSLDKLSLVKNFSKTKDSLVNEALDIKETLAPYPTEDTSLLMQQEGIEINLSNEKLIELDNEKLLQFNKAWHAGPGTDTIVYWSEKTGEIAIAANNLAEILFVWNGTVASPRQIKPVVQDAMQNSKSWEAFEIIIE